MPEESSTEPNSEKNKRLDIRDSLDEGMRQYLYKKQMFIAIRGINANNYAALSTNQVLVLHNLAIAIEENEEAADSFKSSKFVLNSQRKLFFNQFK